MKAEHFLNQVADIVAERERVYGCPAVTLEQIAKRWSLTLRQTITAQQVALCMIDLKVARLTNAPWHADSIFDITGYAACLHTINTAEEKAL